MQEQKELTSELRVKQEAEAAERAKAHAEADALAEAELARVIKQEATDDSWGWSASDGKSSGKRPVLHLSSHALRGLS